MDWTRAVDGYCERTDAGLWAEPLNAVTNLAFLVAALLMWRRCAGVPEGRALAAILGLIGIGSGLFHTLATPWAGLADTLPIAVFVLTYVWVVDRRMLGWSPLAAGVGTALVLPFAALVAAALSRVPFLSVSGAYWSVPLLLLLYAAGPVRHDGAVVRGFVLGAGLLSLSLVARSLDATLCPVLPVGTHWLWHCLNAAMLALMIEVLRRHRLAGRGGAR